MFRLRSLLAVPFALMSTFHEVVSVSGLELADRRGPSGLSTSAVEVVSGLRVTQDSSDTEIITVDGAKNPELIPQWAVWELTLSLVAKSKTVPQELPTAILRTVSPEEEAFIFKQADMWKANYQKCMGRVMDAYTDAFGSTPPPMVNGRPVVNATTVAVDKKMHEITLECRWSALHTRDLVLNGLNPAASTQ